MAFFSTKTSGSFCCGVGASLQAGDTGLQVFDFTTACIWGSTRVNTEINTRGGFLEEGAGGGGPSRDILEVSAGKPWVEEVSEHVLTHTHTDIYNTKIL